MSAVAATRLLGVALLLTSCARSHSTCPEADTATPDAATIDSGPTCLARTGRLVVGPIVAPLPDGSVSGCSQAPDTVITVFIYDESRRPISGAILPCGESDYIDLGVIAAGRYLLAVTSNRGGIGAGGDLIRPATLCPIEGDAFTPVWCAPLVVDVEPCGITVVATMMRCDPTEVVDC